MDETAHRSAARGRGGESSIRARLRFWIAMISTATLVAFTGAAIREERRQLLEAESAHASALLEHLAHMPEFQGDARTAEARLAVLRGSLGGTGGTLELAAPSDGGGARSWTVLARSRLSLRDADLELRYRADPARLERSTQRGVLIHSVHLVLALAALLLAMEWVLRRNLLAPLQALTHQVGLIRDGRGWTPQLPQTDQELRALSEALRELGPGLERQVQAWIEAERRSAVALALVRVRQQLQEARRSALDLLAELDGAWAVAPAERERRIQSLIREVESLPAVIDAVAQRSFASSVAPPPDSEASAGIR